MDPSVQGRAKKMVNGFLARKRNHVQCLLDINKVFAAFSHLVTYPAGIASTAATNNA
jgi:hypothetical protein